MARPRSQRLLWSDSRDTLVRDGSTPAVNAASQCLRGPPVSRNQASIASEPKNFLRQGIASPGEVLQVLRPDFGPLPQVEDVGEVGNHSPSFECNECPLALEALGAVRDSVDKDWPSTNIQSAPSEWNLTNSQRLLNSSVATPGTHETDAMLA